MAQTLESVLKQLGSDASLTGGRIIVYRDGKHTDVGGLGLHDGVFNLTEQGIALLGEAPAEEEPKSSGKGKKAVEKAVEVPEETLAEKLDALE
jgi:hypothetical protein